MKKIVEQIQLMQSDRIRNYVIPGLDSYLLNNGKVRVFENSRNHEEQITPHSHRFDFVCLVLQGAVWNKIWHKVDPRDYDNADEFMVTELDYKGKIGSYKARDLEPAHFVKKSERFAAGQIYGMKSNQIHSIDFSKDAVVLFFEGPTITDQSLILQPFVNHEVIRTFETKDYMFQKVPE